MIWGIGNDILEIDRVRRILQGNAGEAFLARVLTKEEQALAAGRGANRQAEFLAGRFAAKEAVVKALGCGIGKNAGFHDVNIVPDELGKPICTLSPQAKQRIGLPAEARVYLSISHSDTMASAFAVIEIL